MRVISGDWIGWRRAHDDELVGYLVPSGDGVVPVTLFGYPLGEASGQDDAARVLETDGLSCLADFWTLDRGDGSSQRVKIYEVTPDHVTVVADDFNTGGNLDERTVLDVPTDRLRRR